MFLVVVCFLLRKEVPFYQCFFPFMDPHLLFESSLRKFSVFFFLLLLDGVHHLLFIVDAAPAVFLLSSALSS